MTEPEKICDRVGFRTEDIPNHIAAIFKGCEQIRHGLETGGVQDTVSTSCIR